MIKVLIKIYLINLIYVYTKILINNKIKTYMNVRHLIINMILYYVNNEYACMIIQYIIIVLKSALLYKKIFNKTLTINIY